MTPAAPRNTVKVFARHRPDCPAKKNDAELGKCRCPKALLIYEADRKKNRMESAHTASWKRAEARAQEIRDSWDPRLVRLRQLEAAKESNQVRIEEAVALYCADMVARLGDSGTVAMARSLFGHVDPESKEVEKHGHLFAWLDRIPRETRPIHIGDITAPHMTE